MTTAIEMAALRLTRELNRNALAADLTGIFDLMKKAQYDGDIPTYLALDTKCHAMLI